MKQITLKRLAHFLALRSEHRTQHSIYLSPKDLAILINERGVEALTIFRGRTVNGVRIQAHWPPETIQYALRHQLLVERVNTRNPDAPKPRFLDFTYLGKGPHDEHLADYQATKILSQAQAYWELISQD